VTSNPGHSARPVPNWTIAEVLSVAPAAARAEIMHSMSINAQPLPIIELRGVTKVFAGSGRDIPALDKVDLRVRSGELAAVVGRSGSGKSTLINLVAGIDRPTAGEVFVGGTPVHTLDETELARWRGQNVGVVFQFFQLLPSLTIAENVALPIDFAGRLGRKDARARVMSLLEQVGIPEQADKLPSQLSGGQQQRAAIARALANDPQLIIADEPTGNLDSHTSRAVLDLFAGLAARGRSVLMVTHERDVVELADRILTLADGRLTGDVVSHV
jgi:putative ABC transport system ATP-binding protein